MQITYEDGTHIMLVGKKQALLGLDVSSSAVKLIELSRSGGRMRVESYAVEPLPVGAVVENSIADTELVGGAIKRVEAKAKTKTKSAAMAVAGDSSVLLTARGSVAVDERTNTLIVQDTAAKLQEVRDLMQVLDVPVRQVMIEARIVTAESSFSERIGVRWGAFASDNLGNSGIGASIGSGFDAGALGTATQGLNVDLVPAGAQKGAFSLGLAANDVQLNLELNALEAEGRGEVVAQPKIVTADQSPASIQQGAQIPYSTVSDGGTNVQFQNAVLSLDVTPQITPDGNVIMELAIAQDSVGGTTSDGQIIIDTRKLNTTVLVGDGETIVLGGVFEETNNNDVEKVPVLGDLPLLGKLFRNKVVIEDKKELLVFITPKLINDALARR